jgi:hypothetical protein
VSRIRLEWELSNDLDENVLKVRLDHPEVRDLIDDFESLSLFPGSFAQRKAKFFWASQYLAMQLLLRVDLAQHIAAGTDSSLLAKYVKPSEP